MRLVDYEKYYHSGSEFIIPRDEFEKIIEENQRLNNVLNELREWFKEFHKYHSRLKWNEVDYIEFIEHLENELKESDK